MYPNPVKALHFNDTKSPIFMLTPLLLSYKVCSKSNYFRLCLQFIRSPLVGVSNVLCLVEKVKDIF